jgi:tetratricopeptide (TPR) repeat protein
MIGAGAGKRLPLFFMSRYFSTAFVLSALLAFAANSPAQAPGASVAESPSSVEHRGITLAHNGRCKEALPLLKKAGPHVTEKDLQHEGGVAEVGCAMALDQRDTAVEALRALSREFPQDPEVLYLTVHTYSDISSRTAEQLAKTAPNSVSAHQLLAESFEMQGKWDEAAKEYRAILQTSSQARGIHFRLGRLLLSKPDPGPGVVEEAKKEMQLEIELDANNAGAEYVLGEMARHDQQWDDAIAHFSRAAKLDSSFSDAYLGMGTSLLQLKRFPEAVAALETTVKLEPGNPDAHYNLAMAYSRSGRKQDADKEFAIHRQMTEHNPREAPGTESQPGPN